MNETMTVEELIACLQHLPKHMKVGFAYPSGDHWRTTLVSAIKEADFGKVKRSDYHNGEAKLIEDEDDAQGEEIVILS